MIEQAAVDSFNDRRKIQLVLTAVAFLVYDESIN